jgi:hypothetical protein
MKQLTDFESNHECMGTMRFVQIKKVQTPSLNCYIYRREKLDGTFFSYEVFIAKVRHAGDKLPGGLVELEDREVYPKASAFGFTAKEVKGMGAAEAFLAEFVEKLKEKEDKKNGVEDTDDETFEETVSAKLDLTPKVRGRKRKERPALVYPSVAQFGMKDLLGVNEKWTQPLIYIALQSDIKSGIVVEVARMKSESGKGRARVVYSLKTATV